MKFTRGEARGAVLLAATLALLLAVVAWHNGRGVGDVQPPALPSEVRRAADSGENTRPASAGKRKRRDGGKVVSDKPDGSRDRRSPLDQPL